MKKYNCTNFDLTIVNKKLFKACRPKSFIQISFYNALTNNNVVAL